jgi:hypothetical protein
LRFFVSLHTSTHYQPTIPKLGKVMSVFVVSSDTISNIIIKVVRCLLAYGRSVISVVNVVNVGRTKRGTEMER